VAVVYYKSPTAKNTEKTPIISNLEEIISIIYFKFSVSPLDNEIRYKKNKGGEKFHTTFLAIKQMKISFKI